MIKLSKGIYIHFTTVLLFVFCYINRKLEILTISYILVFLHELAHLFAALCIGLKPARIVFFPFGVNLKLKNSIIGALSDEIILYLSGPLLNAVLAILSLFFYKNEYFDLFYYNNLGLFLFNILPILPMDGGILAKKILTAGVGHRRSEIILKCISVVLILFLIIIQGYFLIKNKFNFSILLAVIFLTGNIFTNKEKYNLEFTRELMFYKMKDKKKIKRVKGYQIKYNVNYKDLAKDFSRCNHYIIFKEDKNGKIEEILTERHIIEEILNK
ncbi:MAG: hypothetical protein IJ304_00260 [Clostridia bacterium]|nr:hypothetical protein [Clostridia bacterium]